MRDKTKVSNITDNGDGTFVVRSQSAPNIAYRVDLNDSTCTCPSFQHRKMECKHIGMARAENQT